MNRKFLMTVLALGCATAAAADIIEATALSEPSGQGQSVNAVLLRYDQAVSTHKASATNFTVAGRQVSRAMPVKPCPQYTIPYCATRRSDLVLLQLSPDASSVVTEHVGREPSVEKKITLEITQKSPAATIKTGRLKHLVADNFTQHVFHDSQSGISIPYNLFIPKNYNPKKSYPLVMFVHDAGTTNSNVKNTLYQGNGATVWATPEAQAKEEVFVLAPQFDQVIVNDQSDDPVVLDPTINLIKSLIKEYAIDQNRLYTTEQSGGAMFSLAMNIKYPDFFAASYIVAGQWAADKTAPIAHNKLFILVSENDTKAFPGEKAIVNVLKQHGAVVHESFGWDAAAPISTLNRQAKTLLKQGGNIHFAAFKGGTLPLEKVKSENKGAAHVGTWAVAYDIDAIRNWLLKQHK
ncbi:MAG: hypothetical protein Q4A74_04975 [Cardiobacteriaceae bacterium]|nr:hypothetical protein [Cardiobacteriaceae bacterium]